MRVTQSVYKIIPEKDIITIIEERDYDLELARLNLKGLDKATFTVNGSDTIHSIVRSPDFAKQIKQENGRFMTR